MYWISSDLSAMFGKEEKDTEISPNVVKIIICLFLVHGVTKWKFAQAAANFFEEDNYQKVNDYWWRYCFFFSLLVNRVYLRTSLEREASYWSASKPIPLPFPLFFLADLIDTFLLIYGCLSNHVIRPISKVQCTGVKISFMLNAGRGKNADEHNVGSAQGLLWLI